MKREEQAMKLINEANRSSLRPIRILFAVASVVAVLAVSVPAFPESQTGDRDADIAQFVGVWVGQFDGHPVVTIKLEAKDGKLTGTVNRFAVQMDRRGNLTGAMIRDGEDPIEEVK